MSQRLGSSCRKICPAGTFEEKILKLCARCDDNCVTCDDTDCYLCEDGFLLSDGTCVKTCKEGFYSDMKQECEPCHHRCRSCGGPNHDDCDKCEDNMSLVNGQCISTRQIKCPDEKVLSVQGVCEQCHSTCKTCSGLEKDQCESCPKGIFLTNGQTCVSDCQAETYGNRTSGRCEDCSAGCLKCQDAHHCVKCKAGQLYMQDDKCVAECKRGYPDDRVCHSCAPGCASCEGEPNNCLSCEEDYLRIKHTCVQDCPPKHFVKDGVCERCPVGCAECDHTRTCGECLEYYFLHEGECHDDCPEGFFTNVQQKRCEPCHTDCLSCDGPDPDDCISCKGSRALRYNGKCLNNCPSYTYLDETECRDCDRSCLTCSGPGPSSCLTCGTNMRKDVNDHCEFFSDCSPHTFVDNNGQCQRCHPSCLHCSGPGKDHCLTCNAKNFLLNQTCVSTCPNGYYLDEERQECVHCHMNCASCSGHHSKDCLTCKAGLFLHEHSCFSTCPPSSFVNSSSGVCQACDRTCEECLGSGGFCLKCRDGYLLFRKSGLCLHTCPPHYFPDDDRECKRCHPTCKTCEESGAIYCTSCYEGFGMLAGICSSDCLSGQYKTNDTCAYCDQSCNECKGPGPYNCTGCPALQRLSEDGRCLSCCGEDTNRHSSRFPWECCLCNEMEDECDVRLNYNFFSKGPLPSVRPGVVVFTVIFVLVSLWFAIFSFLHFRRTTRSKPIVKSNGYAKIPDDPFTSATLKDSVQPEYCDKDEDQEDEDEDDDIVYMGRDGIVYRKFKYSMLEGEEPEEEAELEYDDGIHSYIKRHF